MPPSRGTGALLSRSHLSSALRSSAPRSFIHAQSRSLSLASASSLSRSWTCTGCRQLPVPTASSRLARVRFQSNQASSISSEPLPPTLQTPASADWLSSDGPLSDSDRHIGYLLENYGIDFGWGTSSIMKMAFEMVHSTGSEYWVSVLLTGFLIRAGLSPFNRLASNQAARMGALSDLVKPLQKHQSEAMQRRDMAEVQQIRQKIKHIYKGAGVKQYEMFYNFLQIPLGFGMWRTFRNMVDAKVDGLSTGGILWFQDLTLSDPLFIMPLAVVLTQFLTFKFNTENSPGLTKSQEGLQKLMMYGLPVIFLPFISFQPAIIQLHFLTTASFSSFLNYLFRSPLWRRRLGMVPRVAPSSSAPKAPRTINVQSRSQAGSASTPQAASKPAFGTAFTRMRKSVNDFVSKNVENAKRAANDSSNGRMFTTANDKKRQQFERKADSYENQRQQEIAKEKARFETEKKANFRSRR